ncbi:MAG: DUF4912 domain-containing protein [Nitrospinae bacterium]|nr:DUF4912 domain-containing protein [Nitrospinota bacterium]
MAIGLGTLTKAELLDMAAKKKLAVTSSMKKEEIVAALAGGGLPGKKKAAPARPAAKSAPATVAKKPAAPKAASKPSKVAQLSAKKSAPKAVAVPKKAKAVKEEPKKSAKPAATTVKKAAPEKVAPAAKVSTPSAKVSVSPAPVAKAVPAPSITVKKPAVEKVAAKPSPAKAQPAAPKAAPAAAQRPRILNGIGKGGGWDIKIDENKFFIADEAVDYTRPAPALPESYGDTRIVALVRDPFKLYLYWELTGEAVEAARASLGREWGSVRWALRVYDVTGVNTGAAHRYFDVEVDPAAGSRYLDVDKADCEYRVALGLMDADGAFAAVAVSNVARTPRAEMSPSTGLEWSGPAEAMTALYGHAGRMMMGSMESSMLGVPLEEISSQGVSSFSEISSLGVSSFGASEQMVRAKGRGFFFWLDCELIVYGGTEPDATVHMLGRKMALRPDGTFTARFFLPDGIRDIPVTAESSDGVELREISPTVSRSTRRHEEFLISQEEWARK